MKKYQKNKKEEYPVYPESPEIFLGVITSILIVIGELIYFFTRIRVISNLQSKSTETDNNIISKNLRRANYERRAVRPTQLKGQQHPGTSLPPRTSHFMNSYTTAPAMAPITGPRR